MNSEKWVNIGGFWYGKRNNYNVAGAMNIQGRLTQYANIKTQRRRGGKVEIVIPALACPRCGHRWVPRISDPVQCPKCRVPIVRWPKIEGGA